MKAKYFTCRIRIANRYNVQIEIRDSDNHLLGEPSGKFGYKEESLKEAQVLHQAACKGELEDSQVEKVGETLFDILFDEGLRRDFFNCYQKARDKEVLLRIELDIDEHELPSVAALPWEFMRVPASAGYGTVWLGTAPNMILSRRRAMWTPAIPIQLEARENLRIAIAVAAPEGLGPVKYEAIWSSLKKLSQIERIELIELVNPATKSTIDKVLGQKPHIFHFVGHARLKGKKQQEKGEIALVDPLNQPDWVEADDFSELFTRHQPGVVLLQACESGAFSASDAFVGIASEIVQQNIPVVAAMQYEVSNATTRRFAVEFYHRLAENEPVDKAVQEGRRNIALGPFSYKTRDFATPVLFMRVQDGQLFQRQTLVLNNTEISRMQDDAQRMVQKDKFDDAIRIWKDIRDFGDDNTKINQEIEKLKQKKISHLKNIAQQMEQNGAYDEAIKIWEEIKDLGAESAGIDREIERIMGKDHQKGTIQEILQKLSLRMREIKSIYVRVAQRLKRMQKEGFDENGEIVLEVINKFITEDLSVEEFQEMWKDLNIAPSSGEGPEYSALAERLKNGEIIPFLGSEFLHRLDIDLPSSEELVKKLAEGAKYQPVTEPLSKISQYYQMTEYGRGKLIRSIKEIVEPEFIFQQPNPFFQLLANIDNPILIISASYDGLLENIFQDEKKEFVVITHYKTESGLGKVILKYSDKQDPEEPIMAEGVSELNLIKKGYSIIYKICGCFDICGFGTTDVEDSLLLCEDDFFSFAKQMEIAIPRYLVRQVAHRSLLFLGNNLTYWQDRLILNVVLRNKYTSRERSYAVSETPGSYENAYWKFNNVDLYKVNLKMFIDNLCNSLSGL